jgi:zinc protease
MTGFPLRPLLVAAALIGVVGVASAALPAPRTVRLPNGLRVVLAPDSGATAVEVETWFDAGMRTTTAALAAVRPVAEQALFLGSASGARAGAVAAEGGICGSFTSADAVGFWETAPAEALPAMLRIEAQRFGSKPLAAPAFETARRVAVAQARARRDLTPVSAGLTRLTADVWRGEAYSRALTPSDADFARVTPAALEAWRAANLGAGRAVLVIAGRFEPEPTLALVRRLFGALPAGPAAAPRPAAVRRAGERHSRVTLPLPAPMAYLGWEPAAAGRPAAVADEMMAALLGGDPGSPIDRAVRAQSPAGGGARCGVDRRSAGSMFWVAAGTAAVTDTDLVERAVSAVLDSLADGTLAETELEGAKARFVTNELFRLQDVHARGLALGEAVLAGLPAESAFQRPDALGAVTVADVRAAARRLVDAPSRAVLWLLPAGGAR